MKIVSQNRSVFYLTENLYFFRNNTYKEKMFMRRLFRKLVLLIVLGMMLVGCSNKSAKKDKEEFKYFKEHPEIITPDDYIVWSNELNVIVDKEYVDTYSFNCWILSDEELNKEDVKVNIENLETSYEIELVSKKYTSEALSRNYLLALNGINWNELEAYESSDSVEEREEYKKIREEITAEYLKLPNDTALDLFRSQIKIIFDIKKIDRTENETINEMTLVIKGKEYKIDIGELVLKYEKGVREYEDDPDKGFGLWISQNSMNIGNENGLLGMPRNTYGTTQDVTIKEFRLINADEDKTIELIEINNKSGAVESQKYVKGKDINIPADSQVFIDIEAIDKKLRDNQNYATSIYLEIIYERDGNIYSEVSAVFLEEMCSVEEVYSLTKTGIYVP